MSKLRIADVVSCVIISLIVLVGAMDIVKYRIDPEAYEFGSEVSGYDYDNASNFMLARACEVVVGGIALATLVVPPWRRKCMAVRVIICIFLLGRIIVMA